MTDLQDLIIFDNFGVPGEFTVHNDQSSNWWNFHYIKNILQVGKKKGDYGKRLNMTSSRAAATNYFDDLRETFFNPKLFWKGC